MKKLISLLTLAVLATPIIAQQVNIGRQSGGSGSPEFTGVEQATHWDNDIYHAPQYMPGYPTAATLWPRVVDVDCEENGKVLNCNGYHWTPNMGRGEYLMIHPVITPKPDVVTNTVTVTNTIVKEVPVIAPLTEKKIKE